MVSSTLYLTMIYFLMIVRDDSRIRPSEIEVNVGYSLDFSCEPTGRNKRTKWYHQIYPNLPVDSEPISDEGILTIKLSNLKNSGYYYCYGLKRFGSKHFWAQAKLEIFGKSIKIIMQCAINLPILM